VTPLQCSTRFLLEFPCSKPRAAGMRRRYSIAFLRMPIVVFHSCCFTCSNMLFCGFKCTVARCLQRNVNCPVCSVNEHNLADGLPCGYHSQSHLICRMSGQVGTSMLSVSVKLTCSRMLSLCMYVRRLWTSTTRHWCYPTVKRTRMHPCTSKPPQMMGSSSARGRGRSAG
jgi:hypothetical protein